LTPNANTMRSFRPGPETGREFRNALARFGTGVTIVTTASHDGPVGVTANSFSSVSMNPPLVLWSASIKAKRFPLFCDAEDIAIHVLAKGQDDICHGFSRSKDAFDLVNWHESKHGVPLIDGCLARFECKRYAHYDGGDHTIIVSRVMNIDLSDGAPLLFFDGSFGSFELG
jgi:flavin reductase (DIM6/NTAB) family NADH-FMN oxidoreductase RutF